MRQVASSLIEVDLSYTEAFLSSLFNFQTFEEVRKRKTPDEFVSNFPTEVHSRLLVV